MTTNESAGLHILASLRPADGEDGTGIVRMQDRFDTDVDDLWSALTNPRRLARWICEVEGDLRPGGQFRARYLSRGWEGTMRVEACQPPQRLLILTKETGGTDERAIEVTLTADGDQTILVLEQRGLPLDHLPAYGAGIQVEIEDLAAYLAGRERCDSDSRMSRLLPAYQDVAVDPPAQQTSP